MLRPYQQKILEETRTGFRQKHKGILIQSETGSGKTVIFSEIVVNSTKPVWVLVNRIELLTSAVKSIESLGKTPQVLFPESKKFDLKSHIVVSMVQTLNQVLSRFSIDLSHVGLLIVDEAHLTDFDNQYANFPNAKLIGFTATPKRSGRQRQLSDFYTKMVSGPSIKDLIGLGYLVPCEAYTYNVIATKNLKVVRGDYSETMMYSEFDKNIIYSGVVDNWLRLAPNKKTLIFCVNIAHAKSMAEEFNARGIKAKSITSKMDGNRQEILAEWRRGDFPVLINASIFTTGFDEPSIECVVLVRATTSENLYRQMIGRGSRVAPNKDKFILLDFGENIDRHGAYDLHRQYSLTHKTRQSLGAPVMKECPSCGAFVSGSAKICSYCGSAFPLSVAEQVEIELAPYISIDLGTVDVTNLPLLDKIRQARKYKPAWVTRQISIKAPELARGLILEYAMMKGYKSAWAYKEIGRLLI